MVVSIHAASVIRRAASGCVAVRIEFSDTQSGSASLSIVDSVLLSIENREHVAQPENVKDP